MGKFTIAEGWASFQTNKLLLKVLENFLRFECRYYPRLMTLGNVETEISSIINVQTPFSKYLSTEIVNFPIPQL